MTTMRVLSDSQPMDRLAVVQAFCRLMLQISLLAIPVYLGLFMAAVPFDMDAGTMKGIALSVPAMIFLAAAVAYAVGFLATPSELPREPQERMASSQRRLVRRKLQSILIGSGLFAVGVTAGTVLLIKAHL